MFSVEKETTELAIELLSREYNYNISQIYKYKNHMDETRDLIIQIKKSDNPLSYLEKLQTNIKTHYFLSNNLLNCIYDTQEPKRYRNLLIFDTKMRNIEIQILNTICKEKELNTRKQSLPEYSIVTIGTAGMVAFQPQFTITSKNLYKPNKLVM